MDETIEDIVKKRKNTSKIKDLAVSMVKDGYDLKGVISVLEGVSRSIGADIARDSGPISDKLFDELIERAGGAKHIGILAGLLQREDLTESRKNAIFECAIELAGRESRGDGDGPIRDTRIGHWTENALQTMADKGWLNEDQVERLIKHHVKFRRHQKDTRMPCILDKVELRHDQIKQLVDFPSQEVDWYWMSLASQKNADGYIWERILKVVGNRGNMGDLGVVWGIVLRHPKNADSSEWKDRFEAKEKSYTNEARGAVANALLGKNLGAQWDVDKLVDWWLSTPSFDGDDDVRGWGAEIFKRMSQNTRAKLLNHPEKDVRVAVIGLIGTKAAARASSIRC